MRWTETPEERFWSKVDVGLCWLWTAGTNPNGYGQFYVQPGRRHALAHRIAWEWLVGPIPAEVELDHLCRKPRCVNPDHLELVAHRENTQRGATGKMTGARNRAKTQCPHGHVYDEANTIIDLRGSRCCRECGRRRAREYQRRRRAAQ